MNNKLNETDGTGMIPDSVNSNYCLANKEDWQINDVLYNEYGGLEFNAIYLPTNEIINFKFKSEEEVNPAGGQWIIDELKNEGGNFVDNQFPDAKDEVSIEEVQDNTNDGLFDVSDNSSNNNIKFSQASERNYIEDGDDRGDGLSEGVNGFSRKLKEENVNHMSIHDWNSIIQSIDAQMIHMHPEFGEIEFMFNDCHYLIDLEGDELNLYAVEDVDSMNLTDSTSDIDIAQNLSEMMDTEEAYVDALDEQIKLKENQPYSRELYKLTFDNGFIEVIDTANTNFEVAKKYWLGNYFNIDKTGGVKLHRFTKIEQIPESINKVLKEQMELELDDLNVINKYIISEDHINHIKLFMIVNPLHQKVSFVVEYKGSIKKCETPKEALIYFNQYRNSNYVESVNKKLFEKLPEPKAGENESDYVSRAMEAMKDEDKPQDQKLAIAYSTYRNKDKKESIINNKNQLKEYSPSQYEVHWWEERGGASIWVEDLHNHKEVWSSIDEDVFNEIELGLYKWDNDKSVLDYLHSLGVIH